MYIQFDYDEKPAQLSDSPDEVIMDIHVLLDYLEECEEDTISPIELQKEMVKSKNTTAKLAAIGLSYVKNNKEAAQLLKQQITSLKSHLNSIS